MEDDLNFYNIEDDLNFFLNGRRPQNFKVKTTSIIFNENNLTTK